MKPVQSSTALEWIADYVVFRKKTALNLGELCACFSFFLGYSGGMRWGAQNLGDGYRYVYLLWKLWISASSGLTRPRD